MYYQPFGPFDVPRPIGGAGDRWQSAFWKEVDSYCEDLSCANGVYIYSLRHGRKSMPWYIGKTCSQAGFKGEVFQRHKLKIYSEVTKGRRGQPELMFIAKVEPERRNFCGFSSRSRRQIDALETYLIGMGLVKNIELQNDKKTSFHRELQIDGVINSRNLGARTNDARALRNTLGLVNR